jgi:hypothetical protein
VCVVERFVNNATNFYLFILLITPLRFIFSKVQNSSGKVLKLLSAHVELLSFVCGTEEPSEHFRCTTSVGFHT